MVRRKKDGGFDLRTKEGKQAQGYYFFLVVLLEDAFYALF